MSKFYIATRGSALALAQSNMIMAQCRDLMPGAEFELKIIKTTGDKLQTASMAQEGRALPKGLFTKELEVALLNGEAALAVHSLKDLPTELPDGLELGAVAKRADVRDVLIYRSATNAAGRGFAAGISVRDLPNGAVVATSSTRRKAQLLSVNPTLKTPDIRGNVATRLRKIAENNSMDATVLALAGISRLGFRITADGRILGSDVPDGLCASILDTEVMLPCVGQGAIGIEIRSDNSTIQELCKRLTDDATARCVAAERGFLAAMGGGCQSPVAAYAEPAGQMIRMRVLSFAAGPVRRANGEAAMGAAVELGKRLAAEVRG